MKPRSIIVGLAVLAALAALVVWALQPQPISVETAEIARGLFEQTIDDDGKTRVRDRYTVSAPLAGRVLRIPWRAGDTLERGQLIAVIVPSAPALLDQRTLRELEERAGAAQASVLRATAMEERAKAATEQARADADRSRRLAEGGFVSPANLEQALLAVRLQDRALEAAQYERQAAERDAAQARAALTRVKHDTRGGTAATTGFEVYAPIRARVLKVIQESEGAVTIGTPLLELGDVAKLEIVVDVLSTEALGIMPGALAHIDAGTDKPQLAGRVRLIEPAAFTKISALGVEEQRVNVVIDLVSEPESWRALGDGYRVDARIVIHRAEDAVLVPTGALFRDGTGFAVFVVENGVTRKRAVDVQRRNERFGLASKGLAPGERVIVFPGDTVRDGARVEPRNP